jgi:hypothetical protein
MYGRELRKLREPVTCVWDGGGTDEYWTTPANWVGDVAPSPGDNLVFPAGAAKLNSINTFPAGTAFGSIDVSGGDHRIYNGIVSSGVVQVTSGTLTTSSIVCDTLIIGSATANVATSTSAKSTEEQEATSSTAAKTETPQSPIATPYAEPRSVPIVDAIVPLPRNVAPTPMARLIERLVVSTSNTSPEKSTAAKERPSSEIAIGKDVYRIAIQSLASERPPIKAAEPDSSQPLAVKRVQKPPKIAKIALDEYFTAETGP